MRVPGRKQKCNIYHAPVSSPKNKITLFRKLRRIALLNTSNETHRYELYEIHPPLFMKTYIDTGNNKSKALRMSFNTYGPSYTFEPQKSHFISQTRQILNRYV